MRVVKLKNLSDLHGGVVNNQQVYLLHHFRVYMSLWVLFWLFFLAGFLSVWFMFDDIGNGAVFFTDDEELQEMHWSGLRDVKE